jgi:hypothetical protein
MIKFYGLGGEIGRSKDQIQAIRKTGEGEQDLSQPAPVVASSRSFEVSRPSSDTPQVEPRESTGPEPTPREDATNEALEQQQRLKDITEQLENAKQRYVNATQGGGTAANLSKEGINAWVADLESRIKDSQKAPLSEYTPKMRELSQLRNQIDKLQKERDALLQGMNAKDSAASSQ